MWRTAVTLGGGMTMTKGSRPSSSTSEAGTWKKPASVQRA